VPDVMLSWTREGAMKGIVNKRIGADIPEYATANLAAEMG